MRTFSSENNNWSPMRTQAWVLFFALIAPISVLAKPSPTPAKPPAQPVLPLKVAVGVVQKTLADFQAGKDFPKLDTAEFDFKVQTEKVGGINFSIWIVSIGGAVTDSQVHDVTFAYAVPTPAPTAGPGKSSGEVAAMDMKMLAAMDINALAATDANKLANSLAAGTITPKLDIEKLHTQLLEAIKGAAQSIKDAPSVGGAKFDKFTVSMAYGIKYEGSLSANIPVFSFFTIGPKASINRNSTQSVKLSFKLPKPSATSAAAETPVQPPNP